MSGEGFASAILSAVVVSAVQQAAASDNSPGPLYIVGFQGAGGPNSGGNPRFYRFVKELIAKHHGKFYPGNLGNFNNRSQAKAALNDIRAFLKVHPNARIVVMGYSRGGNTAMQLVNLMGSAGLRVHGLVTIDPHNFSNGFKIEHDNVDNSINFFQINPTTWGGGVLPIGDNPYPGSYIDGAHNYMFTSCNECNHLDLPYLVTNPRNDYLRYIDDVVGK
jgi:pimeloyl-ACP methyl ester carboxylesterase